MVTFENVVKEFGNVRAVDGLSFTVEKGENTVLLGTSGCGKTTTLRMINRLTDPTSGQILIDGKNTQHVNPVELRRHIGYVLQNHGLFPHYTVAENIAIVPELLKWPHKKINDRIDELLHQVALPVMYKNRYPQQLSGGQQQRVGIARALAADPPLLLMDEPFGALDTITRRDIVKEFSTLEILKSKTIVIVTHDVKEAFEMGDKLLLMDRGRLVQAGKTTDLLFRPQSKFVTEFLRSQQMQLELSEITLRDIWTHLSEETAHQFDGDFIPDTSNLQEAIEKINGQIDPVVSIKNTTTGETKKAGYESLFTALKALKFQDHE